MAKPLDLSIALKVVERFDGESLQLGHFIETLGLLKAYSEDVPKATILAFLKTRLIGSAHGAIEGVTTLDAAKKAFKTNLRTACEAELKLATVA